MYNGTHGQWSTGGNDYRAYGVQVIWDTWSMGYRGMSHMGNRIQGYGTHGQWGTGYRGMGHMYGQWGTGVWGTWAMGYRGMGHIGNGVQGYRVQWYGAHVWAMRYSGMGHTGV